MQRTRVDLPAPDSPMMPKTSPVSMVSETLSRALTVPALVSNDLDMLVSVIMVPVSIPAELKADWINTL